MKNLIFFCTLLLITNLSAQFKGGYWSFDNDSNDTATWDQINDSGQLYNDAHYSDLDPVAGNNAYLCLDSIAAHDFFQVKNSDDLDFDNENIGISAWIRPVVMNGVHFLITKGVQDANPKTTNYALRISKTKNLEFLIRDAANKAQVASSSLTLTSGQWTFIAAYYDYDAKTVRFWDKPQVDASDTVDFNFDYFSNNDPLTIGAWAMNDTVLQSNSDFEGSMDEVRISGRLEDIIPSLSSVNPQYPGWEKGNDVTVNIYPNPASISGNKGQVRFQIQSAYLKGMEYRIYNILGQKVFQANSGTTANSMNLNWNMKSNLGYGITPGIYFIEFTGMKTRLIKKFLVIK